MFLPKSKYIIEYLRCRNHITRVFAQKIPRGVPARDTVTGSYLRASFKTDRFSSITARYVVPLSTSCIVTDWRESSVRIA